jgi:hypothetical protein
MHLDSLQCNNCGAPLSVPATVNFVTCSHCRTQLAVRRTPTAAYTEKLAEMARQTEQLADQVRHLAWQNELAALDKAWEQEKETYMHTDKRGRRHQPTELGATLGGVIMGVFGLVFLGLGFGGPGGGGGPSGMLGLFGLVAIVGGVVFAAHGYAQASNYRWAEQRYHSRRNALTPESVNLGRHVPFKAGDAIEDVPTPEEWLAEMGGSEPR